MLVPGRVGVSTRTMDVRLGKRLKKDRPSIDQLTPRADEWFDAVDQTVRAIDEAINEAIEKREVDAE